MNTRSEQLLSKVHPELAERARLIAERVLARGYHIEIGQGLRSIAEQNALFAQGRTRKGRIVTKVPGGFSPHNFGCAVDFLMGKAVIDYKSNGQPKLDIKKNAILTLFPDYDVKDGRAIPHPVWLMIAEEAQKLGLEAGYHWKSFQDKPHVEVPELDYGHGIVFKTLYKQGGMARVWKEVDRILGSTKPQQAIHTVVAGDTLSGIAKKYYNDGSAYKVIQDANKFTDSHVLKIGDKLVIPTR